MHLGVEVGKEVGGNPSRQDGNSHRTAGADMIDVMLVPDVHVHIHIQSLVG